jgi:hypothetical protein
MSAKAVRQTALTRKIFTRWINQKLIPHKLPVLNDVVEDLKDGYALINLLQVLSEKEFKGKFAPQTKPFPALAQAGKALEFCYGPAGIDQGKGSKVTAENLRDMDERNILALIWTIMLKFLKFSDDDDDAAKLSAEDALLMWVRNQIHGKELEIVSFGKSFNSGLPLAAIMNKFRPKVLDYDSLDHGNPEAVLKATFAAAEKCFGLEQYLEVADYAELDQKAMLIYVSEYYLGAAQMRKIDLACRRVTKLVEYTRINDGIRAEYTTTSSSLRERVDDALKRLKEHVIDNTMAGAQKNLADFQTYKSTEKGANSSDYLKVESGFLRLTRRLEQHERPVFAPGAGLSPTEFAATLTEIEKEEEVKSVALAKELNRQIRLANIYSQHQQASAKLQAWTESKLEYLNTKETCDSSGVSKYHLNRLAAYDSEAANMKTLSWELLKGQGAELVAEKFEHSAAVQSAETAIQTNLDAMDAQAAIKQAILDDDLARNLYKESIEAIADKQLNRFEVLKEWIVDRLEYTSKKEDVSAVSEAQLQLSLLAAYESSKDDLTGTSVPQLKELNKQVFDASYSTDLSSWEFPDKARITESEKYVDDSWATLASNSAQKKLVLEDDLAREIYREKIRLFNLEHVDRHAKIEAWIAVKEAYLDVREEIDTVDKAQAAIAVLEAYVSDNADMSKTSVAGLTSLGDKITTAEYKTDLSQWTSPDVGVVAEREKFVSDKWAVLGSKSSEKKTWLDAELARELKKEELRLTIASLGGDFMLWSTMKEEAVKASHFGFLLEDVTAYGDILAKDDKEVGDGVSKKAAYQSAYDEAKAIGVVDNRYTELEPANLDAALASLNAASETRKTDYAKELARQQANDALDKEFSALADQCAKTVDGEKTTITGSAGELKEQLAYVQGVVAKADMAPKLAKLTELNDQIKAADFLVRHTTLSALDVDIASNNFETFVAAKELALAAEIEHKELRGVSKKEYEEIQAQFSQFDANGSNNLDLNEFKACLYSLGEEIPKKEVAAIVEKFGEGGVIKYDGFKEFMVERLGDTDTKECRRTTNCYSTRTKYLSANAISQLIPRI